MQLGTYGVHRGSNDLENFWRPARVTEDAGANEVYIADGYGNRRVIVLDEDPVNTSVTGVRTAKSPMMRSRLASPAVATKKQQAHTIPMVRHRRISTPYIALSSRMTDWFTCVTA